MDACTERLKTECLRQPITEKNIKSKLNESIRRAQTSAYVKIRQNATSHNGESLKCSQSWIQVWMT